MFEMLHLWSCKEGPQLEIFNLDSIFFETVSRESQRERVSVSRDLQHTCEHRLNGIALGSACVRGVDGDSSVKRKGDAAFWAASAVGRRSSHEFKQQQGKFRLGIKENFPLIRLMKH